jgi:hypothetical protein
VSVTGLPARVNITHSEAANDSLTVNGQGGNDALSAGNGLAAFLKPITLDGGANDDTLTGGNGIETLIGGDGNDFADGNQGNDTGLMGAGDDTFQWDPGDGNDTVEGQAGHDTLRFNGAGAPVVENVTISANPGGRVTFFRTPGNVTMDLNGVEQIDFNALGGADVVGVNNLAGTDVTRVNTDLAGTLGGSAGDGAPDVVNVLGTPGNDNITVAGDATSLATVSGLPATVGVSHSDGLGDTLDVDADGGTNTADLTGFVVGSIQLVLHL